MLHFFLSTRFVDYLPSIIDFYPAIFRDYAESSKLHLRVYNPL